MVFWYRKGIFRGLQERTLSIFLQILRCWIVYNRSWSVVTLPILLWLGTTGRLIVPLWFLWPFDSKPHPVTGVMALPIQASLSSGQHLSSSRLVPFVTSSLCLSLATNVITTCTISTLLCWHVYFKRTIFQLWSCIASGGLTAKLEVANFSSPIHPWQEW